LGTDQWTYSAPKQIAKSATVRIVAKNAGKVGEATFSLISNVAIMIAPPTANVAAGGAVKFTASGADELTWMAWPVGSVSTDDSGATYSAPAGTQGVQRVIVLAYAVDDDDAAGIAIAHVTIGSST
jgi:hypothetical protein